MSAPTILVLGGGALALEASREVVAQGGHAIMARPGGHARSCSLRSPSGIDLIDDAEIIGLEGAPGRFTAHVRSQGEDLKVECGAVIIAHGRAEDMERPSWSMSISQAFAGGPPERLGIAVIVLGTTAPRPSYIKALDLAVRLRNRPERPLVLILAREMAVHGMDELVYAEAQRQGVRFIRTEEPPELSYEHGAVVRAVDSPSGTAIDLCPDLLVVESGRTARPSEVLPDVPGNISMGTAATVREGVLLCSFDNSDLLDGEIPPKARAAATRAMSIARHPVDRSSRAARVDKDKCSACLTCVRSCPFHAPRPMDQGKSVVDGTLCQACGICVGACPSKAISLPSDQEVEDRLASLGKDVVS